MRVRPFGLASCTRLLTGFHGKACREGVERGIGLDLGRIEVEFLAPDEPSLLALLDHRLEEAPQHLQAVAGTDTRQTRMVGQRLIEMVAEVPAHTESVRRHAEERAFGADPFKEHDQLAFEEDDWIDARSPHAGGITVLDEVAHEREIEHPVEVAVEVAVEVGGGDHLLRRSGRRGPPPPVSRKEGGGSGEPCHLSSSTAFLAPVMSPSHRSRAPVTVTSRRARPRRARGGRGPRARP